MGLLSWIIVGLVAGLLAQLVAGDAPGGCLMTIVIGIVGAFIGGFVMSLFGYGGVTGFNLWSVLVATIGAVLLLLLVRLVRR